MQIYIVENFLEFQESSLSLESQVAAQVDAIIETLQRRKQELMDFIHKVNFSQIMYTIPQILTSLVRIRFKE